MAIMHKSAGLTLVLCVLLFSILASSCRKNTNSSYNLPENFNELSMAQKMETVMHTMSPDSVASFICMAALNKVPNARIDLRQATLYAYEHYKGDDADSFSMAFDNFVESSPLDEKVRLYKLAGTEDPDRLGYELGLGYLTNIREENKDAEEIRRELEALKKECAQDPDFYKRFMIGFKIALKNDRNVDLDENIYKEFINYADSIK